jgi:hypothetical protein
VPDGSGTHRPTKRAGAGGGVGSGIVGTTGGAGEAADAEPSTGAAERPRDVAAAALAIKLGPVGESGADVSFLVHDDVASTVMSDTAGARARIGSWRSVTGYGPRWKISCA